MFRVFRVQSKHRSYLHITTLVVPALLLSPLHCSSQPCIVSVTSALSMSRCTVLLTPALPSRHCFCCTPPPPPPRRAALVTLPPQQHDSCPASAESQIAASVLTHFVIIKRYMGTGPGLHSFAMYIGYVVHTSSCQRLSPMTGYHP